MECGNQPGAPVVEDDDGARQYAALDQPGVEPPVADLRQGRVMGRADRKHRVGHYKF